MSDKFQKKDVIDFFNKLAPSWEKSLIRNDEIINYLLDNADIKEGTSVLDVACGTGILVPYYLDRNVNKVLAIDIAEKMIDIAKDKYKDSKIEFICADVENYHFSQKFDRIVVYNAFPHFPNQEHLIEVLSSLLNKDGVLTICHGLSRDDINKHHANVMNVSLGLISIEELNKMMSKYLDVTFAASLDDRYQIVGVKR